MDLAVREWAEEEFGGARLGDARRVDRLVRLAAQAASGPAGTVTAVVSASADREGAFRLLENTKVPAEAVAWASHDATVARAREYSFAYVPVDGSSLSLTDRSGKRAVGHVGAFDQHGRGLITQTALCVSPDGTPIGVCGQQYWARHAKQSKKEPHHSAQTEMGKVVHLLKEVQQRFEQQAPAVQPWYQLDRGYDAWLVLKLAKERNLRLTVRATHNRRVREDRNGPVRHLNHLIQAARPIGFHTLQLPARDGMPSRCVRLAVRAFSAMLELPIGRKRRQYERLNVVVATEVGRRNGLCWKLLTTEPVSSLQDARAVLRGYEMRWRIEEFHRAWKRGVCHVEDTQLRSFDAIAKWATILAAVAARATRLTYLAREKPDTPALDELTQLEVDAAVALRKPKGVRLGARPTLAEAVRWIADIGGYTGKSSGGPPGPTVIARGLAKVELLAEAIRNLDKLR